MFRALRRLTAALLLVSVLTACGSGPPPLRTPDAKVGTKEPASSELTAQPGLPTSPEETSGATVKTPDEVPVLAPEPRDAPLDDHTAWDEWFDGRTRQVTDWLTRPATYDWSDERLGEALQVRVYRNEESPYRFVQLGPLQMPIGTMKFTSYWIQWRDASGTVQAQQMHPNDIGTHEGHRVFETEGGSVLILLVRSVFGAHNSSVWAWRMEGQTWVPMEGSFEGVESADASQLILAAEKGGGLGVSNRGDKSLSRPPHLYFHETLHTSHAILCSIASDDTRLNCYKVAWNGQRFQLSAKPFQCTGPGEMECQDLAIVGITEVIGLWAAEVEAALGKPAAKRTEENAEHWEYPNLGLTATPYKGKV